jgi:cytochrome c biogenesis protein CcdA
MLEQISESLAGVIETNAWLAPLAAFAGGTLTAANPCVLAAVPLMMAYLAGQSECRGAIRSFLLSLAFATGLIAMFAIMFLAAWAAGSILRANWWVYIAAAVCLIMGLHLLGVLSFTIPAPPGVRPSHKGFIGALLLGLLFGLISLPCAGPILLVLLSLVPMKGAAFGGTLLVAYGLGHCALILVGGTSMGLVQRVIDSKGYQRANIWCKRFAGLVAIGIGIALLAS